MISWILIVLVVVLIAIFRSGSGENNNSSTTEKSETGITEITFFESPFKMVVGEDKDNYFSVTSDKDFSIDEIDFVSTSPEVASFKFEKRGAVIDTNIHYIITAIHTGETKIYAQTKDGIVKSDEITVTVTGMDTSKSEDGITSIYFNDSDGLIELEVGEISRDYFSVDFSVNDVNSAVDFSIDDMEFISTSPEVATFDFEKSGGIFSFKFYYVITAISPGATTIYVKSKDDVIKSDEITVTVVAASPWIEAAWHIYIGVKLYNITEGGSMYVGEVTDINDYYYDPYTGDTFRGMELKMPDGSYEWKDRIALLSSGYLYIKSDDPNLP